MSKIKMRCTSCGKWFQSANAKEVTCPDCVQKARKEKLAAKATQQTTTSKPGQGGISSSKPLPPPPKAKEATSGTSHWIDTVEDVKVSQPEQSKPKREKIPPPAPFTPTPEQIAQVEARYLELAVPTEFDGIRTQIVQELGIPKKAVKKIVKDFRDRQSIPSWWELQTYKGSSEEMEKIRAAYEPYLPLPPIGVHKTIAEELTLNPGDVYQAIKAIRLERNLPQYNDPSLHGQEPISGDKKQPATSEEGAKEPQEEDSESDTGAIETRSEPVEVVTSSTSDNRNIQE